MAAGSGVQNKPIGMQKGKMGMPPVLVMVAKKGGESDNEERCDASCSA